MKGGCVKLQVKTSLQVIVGLHSQVCTVRSMLRLSETEGFRKAFDAANEAGKDVALKLINDGDKDGLCQWIKVQLHTQKAVECLSIRELRQLGQQLGVRHYNVLPKGRLIHEIKLHQKGQMGNA